MPMRFFFDGWTSRQGTDMQRYLYSVTAALPNPAVAEEYVRWLLAGHARAVVDAGALRVEVVRHQAVVPLAKASDAPIRVESIYVFPDRAAFDRYVRDAAPRLRADGLARFGPEALGADAVTFERREGAIVGMFDRSSGSACDESSV
jgi:hypothetical protein